MGNPVFFRSRNLDVDLARSFYNCGYSDSRIAHACRTEVRNVKSWREKMGLPENLITVLKTRSLAETEAEARRLNMSYGEYTAAMRLGKVTV